MRTASATAGLILLCTATQAAGLGLCVLAIEHADGACDSTATPVAETKSAPTPDTDDEPPPPTCDGVEPETQIRWIESEPELSDGRCVTRQCRQEREITDCPGELPDIEGEWVDAMPQACAAPQPSASPECPGKVCPDGKRVADGAECPKVGCPDGSEVEQGKPCLCPDGSPMPETGTCPVVQCPDGSEVENGQPCLCPNGARMPETGDCQFTCPDNSRAAIVARPSAPVVTYRPTHGEHTWCTKTTTPQRQTGTLCPGEPINWSDPVADPDRPAVTVDCERPPAESERRLCESNWRYSQVRARDYVWRGSEQRWVPRPWLEWRPPCPPRMCPDGTTEAPGGYLTLCPRKDCPDGTTVRNGQPCSPVQCEDGRTVANGAQCPPLVRCPDGVTVAPLGDVARCPRKDCGNGVEPVEQHEDRVRITQETGDGGGGGPGGGGAWCREIKTPERRTRMVCPGGTAPAWSAWEANGPTVKSGCNPGGRPEDKTQHRYCESDQSVQQTRTIPWVWQGDDVSTWVLGEPTEWTPACPESPQACTLTVEIETRDEETSCTPCKTNQRHSRKHGGRVTTIKLERDVTRCADGADENAIEYSDWRSVAEYPKVGMCLKATKCSKTKTDDQDGGRDDQPGDGNTGGSKTGGGSAPARSSGHPDFGRSGQGGTENANAGYTDASDTETGHGSAVGETGGRSGSSGTGSSGTGGTSGRGGASGGGASGGGGGDSDGVDPGDSDWGGAW